jgi:NifB/MoaA-like Fe-S oxidoreductase
MEEYDDFAQYENGVGIAASFVEEAASRLHQALEGIGDIQPRRLFLLSGTLAAGLMGEVCRGLADEFGFAILPLVAENRLFGPYVTVTGLLGGRDIIRAAESAGLGRGDLLLIPAACLNTIENPCFLDDLTLEKLDEALNCIVAVT